MKQEAYMNNTIYTIYKVVWIVIIQILSIQCYNAMILSIQIYKMVNTDECLYIGKFGQIPY